jgi:ureidoacrylate peracid hydrolase
MMTFDDWDLTETRARLVRAPRTAREAHFDALPQRLEIDVNRAAVIVVDMQNDFCHEDGWLAGIGVDISAARRVIPRVADLVGAAHAADVPVIWVNWGNRPDRANLPPGVRHVYDPAGQGVGIGSLSNAARTPVLEKGSWSAHLVDELEALSGGADIRIDKYRMSGFPGTPLDAILRNLGVSTILFAGVNSDQCVYATLVDAASLGYDVVLVEDASATTSPAFCHDATVYNTRQCYGFTARTADVAAALAGT